MADISKAKVDNVEYDIKDAVARAAIGDLSALSTEEKSNLVAALNEIAAAASGGACGITYLESDSENPTAMRDIDSGTYVFYGRFKPFAGSSSTINFSSKLLVNVVKQSSASHIMVFYPVNNCVQYLKATDTDYERKNVYLNDLMDTVDTLETAVGDLTTLATTEKTSLVAAINEVKASGGSGSGESDVLIVTITDNVASHTAIEIGNAVADGKIVYLNHDGILVPLFMAETGNAVFYTTSFDFNKGINANSLGVIAAVVDSDGAVTMEMMTKTTVPASTASDSGKALIVDDSGNLAWDGSSTLVVTIDLDTNTASHSKSEIEDAIAAGKAVVGMDEGTVIGTYSVGYGFIMALHTDDEVASLRIFINEDKSVTTFTNKGTFVPTPTEADYGKVLSATADGLVWVTPSGGGGSVPSAEGVEF